MKTNKTFISNKQLADEERKQNETISNNYSSLYVELEQLEKELKNTPESDIKRIGYLKAKIALINKKKRSFEKHYFNY